MTLLFYFFFTMRRLLLIIIVVLLREHPSIQMMLYQILSVLNLAYLGYLKPYEAPIQNKLELFNEICITSVGYLMFIFTEYVTNLAIKDLAGYLLIGIVTLNFVTNFAIILRSMVLTLKNIWLHRNWYRTMIQLKLCRKKTIIQKYLSESPLQNINAINKKLALSERLRNNDIIEFADPFGDEPIPKNETNGHLLYNKQEIIKSKQPIDWTREESKQIENNTISNQRASSMEQKSDYQQQSNNFVKNLKEKKNEQTRIVNITDYIQQRKLSIQATATQERIKSLNKTHNNNKDRRIDLNYMDISVNEIM